MGGGGGVGGGGVGGVGRFRDLKVTLKLQPQTSNLYKHYI